MMTPIALAPTQTAIHTATNNPPLSLQSFGIIFGILSGFVSALAGTASWWVMRKVRTQNNVTPSKISSSEQCGTKVTWFIHRGVLFGLKKFSRLNCSRLS